MTNLAPRAIAGRLRRITGVLRRRRLLRAFWWLRGPGGIELTVESAPRWRDAFQELGPTFVKFGQLLSLRADLLPPEVTQEFGKLQDRTVPFPFVQVRTAVEADLGGPLDRFFASFEEAPLAAASIAQVHGARLLDGAEVVVKVQRPEIRESIENDLRILQALAALIERVVPEARFHRPLAIVEEFRRAILKELDFRAEARAMERFRLQFASSPDVCVPAVHRELSGPHVLVAERLEGRRITDLEGVPEAERARLARAVNDSYLTQIFEFGLFHADPHPGNVVVLPDGRICFHDFGIVGRLSTAQRRALADLFRGVLQRDAERLLEIYLRLGTVGEHVRRDALRAELEELLEEYTGLELQEFSAGEMFGHMLRLARRYRILFPAGFFLLGKTLIMIESITRTLDPSYDATAMVRERATTLGEASFKGFTAEVRRIAQSSEDFLAAVPTALSAAARKMREGTFDLKLRHEKLEELESRLDRSFNRLTFGVVTAAIIVGSSIIMNTNLPPRIYGVPVLGVLGFITAAFLGFGLLIAILRGGRM